MELMLLRVHQGRIADACEAGIIAINDINGFNSVESGRFWYGMQNLVVAAGNLSKSLFGSGPDAKRERLYREREPLRASLQVDDSSPLKKVVIRNDLEHLDERIDEWWSDSPNRNFTDAGIGPKEAIQGMPGGGIRREGSDALVRSDYWESDLLGERASHPLRSPRDSSGLSPGPSGADESSFGVACGIGR